MEIKIEFREMTDGEYKREQVAFDEQALEFGNPPEGQERFGFVATDGDTFIGCSSGLAQKNGESYGRYFYLSDLFVEKEYRKQGLGKRLLENLEEKMKPLGVEIFWTWTAGFEAAGFYRKQGYEVFSTFENFYPSGHARIGFLKKL